MSSTHARPAGEHDPSTFGVHGMVVFGGQRTASEFGSPVYVSHMPMFMAPHDFQVILRVTGEVLNMYVPFVAHFGSSEICTFRPDPFSIAELDPSGGGPVKKSISGTLFRGHFERGGSELGRGTSCDVEHVVRFEKFTPVPEGATSSELRYVCFGERDGAFLAHIITAPPDFDQILDAKVTALDGVSDDDLKLGVTIAVPNRANTVGSKLQAGEAFSGEVRPGSAAEPASMELTAADEHYLETGDLTMAM